VIQQIFFPELLEIFCRLLGIADKSKAGATSNAEVIGFPELAAL
jgi:hypothetical protein